MNHELNEAFNKLIDIIGKDMEKSSGVSPAACKPHIDEMWRVIATFYALHSQLNPNQPLTPEEQRTVYNAQKTLSPYLDWYYQETGEAFNFFREAV